MGTLRLHGFRAVASLWTHQSLTGRVMSSALKTAAVMLILPLMLAGCGIRGSLEAPQQAKADGTATSPEAADPGTNSAAKPQKHRPFVLDGLLR